MNKKMTIEELEIYIKDNLEDKDIILISQLLFIQSDDDSLDMTPLIKLFVRKEGKDIYFPFTFKAAEFFEEDFAKVIIEEIKKIKWEE